jgi:hypothetical protein
MKFITISAMHGRHKTVAECIERMPFIDKVYIYSTDEDGAFLEGQDIYAMAKYRNNPLSYKWNMAIRTLEQIDFDAVILLGSDDYIDEAFLKYAERTISDFDMIGFKDIYFQHEGGLYYWSGYTNNRRGEPIGAGKVYSRKFLECIDWNLFDVARDRGLDRIAWKRVQQAKAKVYITTLKENGLLLVDIKDGEGMTSFNSLGKMERVSNKKT